MAVKVCDINNNSWGYEMILNEVQIYNRIKPLQGTLIPKLYFYGYMMGVFIIALEYIDGSPKKFISMNELQKIRERLLEYGVVHDDLKKRGDIYPNLLQVGKATKVIDFGLAHIVTDTSTKDQSLYCNKH